MSISYRGGEFEIVPDECPNCETDLYDSGCAAPGCPSAGCSSCGWGCDLDFAGEAGRCAQAIAAESDEDLTARVNQERAAVGLSPLSR